MRPLFSVSLIAAPVLTVAAGLLHPSGGSSAADVTAAASAHPDRWTAAHGLLLLFVPFGLIALLGLARSARAAGSRAALAIPAIAVAGGAALAAAMGLELSIPGIVANQDHAVAAVARLQHGVPAVVAMLPALMVVAIAVTAVAVRRLPGARRAAVPGLAIAAILIGAGNAVALPALITAGGLALLVGFASLAPTPFAPGTNARRSAAVGT